MIELTEQILNYSTLELSLSNINKKITEAEHKLAVSELNYDKCCKMYSKCHSSDPKIYKEYSIKYAMEKMEHENELDVLLDEYQRTLKQMKEIYEEEN